jgi:hypothetical protein
MPKNNKWIVEDWAGNRMFPDKRFSSFEAGWNFVQSNTPEEDWEDIYVKMQELIDLHTVEHLQGSYGRGLQEAC